MRYEEIINEVTDITLLVDNLRKNLALAVKGGVASDIEGIDAVVRLGYLGKYSPESIAKSFNIIEPWTMGAAGSYNRVSDELKVVFDRLLDPQARVLTATTVTHELRHRAFSVISQLPELNKMMPRDLLTQWKDGYGDFDKFGNYNYKPKGFDQKIGASPEHAMIYAVQGLGDGNWRRVFYANPKLQSKTVGYWKDLYQQVNQACTQYIEQQLKQPTTGDLPGGALAKPEDLDKNFRWEPWVEEYYTAWDKIINRSIVLDFQLLYSYMRGYAVATITKENKKLYDLVNPARSSLQKGHLSDVLKSVNQMIQTKDTYTITKKTNGEIWYTQEEWDRVVDKLSKQAESMKSYLGPEWRLYDVRNFDGTFNRVFAPTVNKPAPPKVPTKPVQPPKAPPSQPPVVAPKGKNISVKQFAQENLFPGTNKSCWQMITTSRDAKELEYRWNTTQEVARLAGLKLKPSQEIIVRSFIQVYDQLSPTQRVEGSTLTIRQAATDAVLGTQEFVPVRTPTPKKPKPVRQKLKAGSQASVENTLINALKQLQADPSKAKSTQLQTRLTDVIVGLSGANSQKHKEFIGELVFNLFNQYKTLTPQKIRSGVKVLYSPLWEKP